MGIFSQPLKPQAWVFVRCELGGGGIRAELAEGEGMSGTCIWGLPPQRGRKGSLFQHHPTPTCSSQDRFQGRRPKGIGASLEWALAWSPTQKPAVGSQ